MNFTKFIKYTNKNKKIMQRGGDVKNYIILTDEITDNENFPIYGIYLHIGDDNTGNVVILYKEKHTAYYTIPDKEITEVVRPVDDTGTQQYFKYGDILFTIYTVRTSSWQHNTALYVETILFKIFKELELFPDIRVDFSNIKRIDDGGVKKTIVNFTSTLSARQDILYFYYNIKIKSIFKVSKFPIYGERISYDIFHKSKVDTQNRFRFVTIFSESVEKYKSGKSEFNERYGIRGTYEIDTTPNNVISLDSQLNDIKIGDSIDFKKNTKNELQLTYLHDYNKKIVYYEMFDNGYLKIKGSYNEKKEKYGYWVEWNQNGSKKNIQYFVVDKEKKEEKDIPNEEVYSGLVETEEYDNNHISNMHGCNFEIYGSDSDNMYQTNNTPLQILHEEKWANGNIKERGYKYSHLQSLQCFVYREEMTDENDNKNIYCGEYKIKNIEKTGIWHTYFENKNMESEITYKYGIHHGLSHRWDDKGNLKISTIFVNNKSVKSSSSRLLSLTDTPIKSIN